MGNHPRSLLELTQAPLHPSPIDQSALLIIDAQMEYITGKLPLVGMDAALAGTEALLRLARRHGMPVFHVVQQSDPGRGLFEPTGPFVVTAPNVSPIAGECVVTKKLPNAFAGTDLDRLVRASGRHELILAGFMTHMCVSSTAMAALDLGYRTTVVADATATRDVRDPVRGDVVPADLVHRAALAALADRFAIVVPNAAALEPR
jgi:nicotinamidase-related amidase